MLSFSTVGAQSSNRVKNKMELSFDVPKSEAESGTELDAVLQARAYEELKALGLLQAPEYVQKLLSKNPDGLTPPRLMRWTRDAQLHESMNALSPQEQALWERNWEILQQASELPPEKCQTLAEAQLPTIELLLERHPNHPVLQNQLCQAYKLAKQPEAYRAEAEKMLAAHPNYLFALLTVAEIAQSDDTLERFAQIFGGRYEIQEYGPERLYHVSEIASFYGLLCPWHIESGRLLRAAWAFALVRHAYPEHPILPELIQLWLGLPESLQTKLKAQLSPKRKLKSLKQR